MIDELGEWQVRSRALREAGKFVEEVYVEFALLWESFADLTPNLHRARGLQRKIDYCSKRLEAIKPGTRFDRLVHRDYVDSLGVHRAWIELFFTKQGSESYGVRNLFNVLFAPEDRWNSDEDAWNYVRNEFINMPYRDLSKRENLLNGIQTFQLDNDYEDTKRKIDREFPRLKRFIRDFDVERKFISKQEGDFLNILDIKREIQTRIERLEDHFRVPFEEMPMSIRDMVYKLPQDVFDVNPEKAREIYETKFPEIDRHVKKLDFDLRFMNSWEYSASWNSAIGVMEFGPDFCFFKDKETGEIKFYGGDLFRTAMHENAHRLKNYFSRDLPAGIRPHPAAINFFAMTVEEGTAMYTEEITHRYISNIRKRMGLSKKDLERAKWMSKTYLPRKLVILYHALLHREQGVEQSDYDVHLTMAKESGNWGFVDHIYLDDDDLSAALYHGWYIFGKKFTDQTISALECEIKKRLGTRDKRRVRNFMQRNEHIIQQCLLTGDWGWSTHQDFVVKHALPKAWRYMD